jgi:hypothetical protein
MFVLKLMQIFSIKALFVEDKGWKLLLSALGERLLNVLLQFSVRVVFVEELLFLEIVELTLSVLQPILKLSNIVRRILQK